MDRNLLIAFVLSFLVLYTWSAWQESLQPPPMPGEEQVVSPEGAMEAPGGEEAAPEKDPRAQRYADLPGGAAAPIAGRTQAPASERSGEPDAVATRVEIDRPLYHAVLTTQGGALEAWSLKEYLDAYGDPVAMVERNSGLGDVAVTPFVELGQGDLSRVAWQLESEDVDAVVFALERNGIRLRKTWQFSSEDYTFRLRLEVENASGAVISPRFLVDWPVQVRDNLDFNEQQFALLQDGEVEQTPVAGVGSAGFFGGLTGSKPVKFYDYPGEIDWAGLQSTYFLAALLPDSPTQASARIAVLETGKAGAVEVFFDSVELPPGQSLTREFRGYVGPKEAARLETHGGGLDRSIDLGWSWVAPLTRGFNWLLTVLYSFIPNYGLAIIILTILVRGVTAPLTVKQMKSMERLRRVQPRMKEIQEKYADDKPKQSEEMMKLYKVEKVNPLGGCFPMLLQLPVFIGLFYALRSSISLRQAPFFGWIDDLSAPEALFELPGLGIPVRVLPLIMGGTMFLQQKITPMQTPDPAQARMMMTVMPLMMTVLFYQFASGLVLYWMMSNVLAILHQLWIGRNMDPPAAKAEAGNPAPKAA